jgi:hypothetical protein
MLANIIIGFIGMVVMFMLWYQNHDKYSGIAYWVLDWILLTGGMALISLQGNIPPWESMILSNSMIVGGMAILYFGLRSFAGKKSSPLLISSVLVGFAAFVIIHTYFTVVDVNLTARSLNTAGGLLLGCLIGMWLMFKEVSPQIRRISTGTGIAFGMIINELVTNSLKYAFPGNRKGLITISLTENEKGLQLTVGDDGVGIPEGVSLANNSTLGIKLVSNLVRDQLGGTLEIDRRHGTSYQISFPRNKEEK